MKFEQALAILRQSGEAQRYDWSTSLTMRLIDDQHVILRTWPSGHSAVYQPIMEDLVADDWQAAPFPEKLP